MNSRNDRTGRTRLTRSGRVFLAVGFALLLAGIGAWAWVGEWRWAMTGLLGALITVMCANVTTEAP